MPRACTMRLRDAQPWDMDSSFSRWVNSDKQMNIVYPEMYRDTVFTSGVFPCLLCVCTRASLCLLSVLVLQTNMLFPEVSLEIHCREVSNAEASQLKERVNWKASVPRVEQRTSPKCEYLVSWTKSEPGYLVLLIRLERSLVLRTKLGTWSSRGVARWDLVILISVLR